MDDQGRALRSLVLGFSHQLRSIHAVLKLYFFFCSFSVTLENLRSDFCDERDITVVEYLNGSLYEGCHAFFLLFVSLFIPGVRQGKG